MGNVIGQLSNRDKNTYEILTGQFPFHNDQWGGKKFFGAVKLSTCAKGSINKVAGKGCISNVTVANGGSGYTSMPIVTINGGGSGATARASIFNGKVVYITLIQRGSGYSNPTVTITGGGGSGATATCTVSAEEPDIDFSKALAVNGVHAVLNNLDARGNLTSNVFLVDSWGSFGAPIAAVIADDWDTAVYACGLIDVKFEDKPWITDPYEALKAGVPVAGPDQSGGDITVPPNTTRPAWGSLRPAGLTDTQFETALAACDKWVTHNQGITTNYAHNMLEPHGNTAWWVGDHCYIWTPTQNLHSGHSTFVSALGRNSTASGLTATVHTFTRGTGGGHGDKTSHPMGGLCARMSLFVGGAPVTLSCTRTGNQTAQNRQSGSSQKIRIGGSNGKILVFESDGTCFGGVTSALAASNGTLSHTGGQQSYAIPTYRSRTANNSTNTATRGPWRCVGDPPGCMGYDSAIDVLATALNVSPYQLRINSLRDRNTPALASQSNYCMELPTILKKVHDESGYATKWHAPKTNNVKADGRLHGIALSCHVDSHGSVSGSGRNVSLTVHNINNTPNAFLLGGFGRGPSGAPSAMGSIVAERMGLNYDNVYVEWGQSDKTWPTGNQAGSGFTSGCGGSAYNAANKARNEILTAALGNAALTGLAVPTGRTRATATANVTDGRITSITINVAGAGYTGDPRVTITGGGGSGATAVANVVGGKVINVGVTNTGSGYTDASAIVVTIGWLSVADLDPKNNEVRVKAPLTEPADSTTAPVYPIPIYSLLANTSLAWYGDTWATTYQDLGGGVMQNSSAGSSGACAEVLVDPETGEVEVTGMWNCVDTGGTIFRRGFIKEAYSGCELMISQTLFYGDIYDHKHTGAIIGNQWSQSHCPTSMDLPCNNYNVYDIESGDIGPFGAHGIGEPCVSNVSSVYCAIYNAIGVFPDPEQGALNPDRILKALGKA